MAADSNLPHHPLLPSMEKDLMKSNGIVRSPSLRPKPSRHWTGSTILRVLRLDRFDQSLISC